MPFQQFAMPTAQPMMTQPMAPQHQMSFIPTPQGMMPMMMNPGGKRKNNGMGGNGMGGNGYGGNNNNNKRQNNGLADSVSALTQLMTNQMMAAEQARLQKEAQDLKEAQEAE